MSKWMWKCLHTFSVILALDRYVTIQCTFYRKCMATFLPSTAHISVAFYSILIKFSVLLLFVKAFSEYVIQMLKIRKKFFVTSHFGTLLLCFLLSYQHYLFVISTLCFWCIFQGRDMILSGIRDHGVGIGIRDFGIIDKSQGSNLVNVFKSIFVD